MKTEKDLHNWLIVVLGETDIILWVFVRIKITLTRSTAYSDLHKNLDGGLLPCIVKLLPLKYFNIFKSESPWNGFKFFVLHNIGAVGGTPSINFITTIVGI